MCISMQEFRAPGLVLRDTIEGEVLDSRPLRHTILKVLEYNGREQRDSTLMSKTKGFLNVGVTTGVQDRIVDEGEGSLVGTCGQRRDARDCVEKDTLILSSNGLKGGYP